MTGVPDILGRVKPILASLIPGREPSERVTELKPWARRAVVTYVVLLVPALLGLLVLLVVSAPRLFATAYDSAGLQLDRIGDAISDGAVALTALGAVQLLALLLPCAAIVLTAWRLGRRSAGGIVGWASGSAARTALAATATLALVGLAAYTWWPNGDYEPIRPGEKGTLSEVASSVREIPSGRPAWTPAREADHGAERTTRERRAPERGTAAPVERDQTAPAETTTTPAEEEEPVTTTPAEPAPAPAETTPAPAAPAEEPATTVPAEPPPAEPAPTVTPVP